MKSLSLIISLILTVGYLASVTAVTDAELEALEKQIEQQEAEEKQKAKAEAKRRAEAEKLAEEKKRLAEIEKQLQEKQRQLEDEEKKNEETQLAELERQHQEEEAKKRAEEGNKEKYTLLIAEAEQAVSNKDKELAISKYNEALTLYPNNPVANSGVKEAEKLMDKLCYEVLAKWDWEPGILTQTMDVKEDGTYIGGGLSDDGTWECIDPTKRLFLFRISALGSSAEQVYELSVDGTCLNSKRGCWRKFGYKSEREPSTQKTPAL